MLIVDDDEGIRETLRDVLLEEGFIVEVVTDGHTALRFLQETPYSTIVLLDHLMPTMDGIEVLQEVAKDDADLSTRHVYLLVTASAKLQQLETSISALAPLIVPIIPKPFSVDGLIEAVQQVALRLPPEADDGAETLL